MKLWPGGVIERAHRAHADLRRALGREVRRLSESLSHPRVPRGSASTSRAARSNRWYAGSSRAPNRTPCSEPSRIVGFSESTTCYVAPAYLAEDDPFADFIVHEVAHIFHNCKRRTLGLRETRSKEWLLQIDYQKRETFAYSCEAYARLTAPAETAAERRAFAVEYGTTIGITDERVDLAEVTSIVTEAASERASETGGT